MIGCYIFGVARGEGARRKTAGKFTIFPPISEPRLLLHSLITPFI